MAAIANGIDFMTDLLQGSSSNVGTKAHVGTTIKMLYAGFSFMWLVTFGLYSDADFSVVMTAGTTLQALAWLILCLEVRSRKSVVGLSSKTLVMFFLFYLLRLTSTCLKNGYIPVDKSGDFMMQGFDVISLCCVVYLIFCIHRKYEHSYQEEYDTCDIKNLVAPAVILGYFLHGDFNKNEFFDVIWATSLNIETLTLIPQLWMMAKIGGTVNNSTSHWVFCQVMAAVCRFVFWWWAYVEQNAVEAGYHIITCHFLQLFLCADFMFYYVQSYINGSNEVALPSNEI